MILAGSADYPGAAVLAANGAMRSGAGIVTVASPESALNAVAERVIPEVITRSLPETASGTFSEMAFEEAEELASQADVVAVGCGIGSSEEATRGFVKKVIEGRSSPLVIDADGLNAIAPMSVAGNDALPLVLTPHEGEFRRLLGDKDASAARGRIGCARDFAVEHGVFLVSKGERVLIAAPDGRAVVNPTGNSGLGKAGNGDNLTGIIAGFLAQGRIFGIGVFSTLVAAVYLSGLAGDIARERFGRRVMVASDVREALAEAISRVADDDPERGAGSRVRKK